MQQQIETKNKSMIERLRDEAKKDKALNAVCHIFAIRERARQQVTLQSLRQTMTKEGFDYSTEDYHRVLKTLATVGVGTLQKDSYGKPRAVTNIKYTLQSLGAAVVKESETPKRFTPRNRYQDVAPEPVLPPIPPPPMAGATRDNPLTPKSVQNVCLTATINNMPVVFVIAEQMEPSQLGQLLIKLGSGALPQLT